MYVTMKACMQPRSQLLFPSQRKENRAVQVVEVRAPSSDRQRPYTFTFCLERVDVGPYKVAASFAGSPFMCHCSVTLEGLSTG